MDVSLSSVLLLCVILLVGFLLGNLLPKTPLEKLVERFVYKAVLIKQYWKFTLVFTVLMILSYWMAFTYSSVEQLNTVVNVIGQVSALVFAVFVGWFAFIQVVKIGLER